MPGWFAYLFPYFDALSHRVGGRPRRETRGFVKEYVGRHHAVSSARSRRELAWSPRPLEVTLKDTMTWFRERNFASRG
jgi:nucleoside-diphosphate-sugar epimerase